MCNLVSDTSTPHDLRWSSSSSSGELFGRGHRTKVQSCKLRDFVTHTTVCENIDSKPSTASPSPSRSSSSPFDIACYVDYSNYFVKHRSFLAAVTKGQITIEAVKHPGWRKAMEEEIATLKCKGTWSLEDLSSGKKAIGSGWVYSIKYTTTGKVERFKGRLVVHGNRQIEGVDYRETFAPVAKMTTVYLFLVVVVSLNWELYHMDVQNAFLHGYLHKEVYMKLATGYRGAPPGYENCCMD